MDGDIIVSIRNIFCTEAWIGMRLPGMATFYANLWKRVWSFRSIFLVNSPLFTPKRLAYLSRFKVLLHYMAASGPAPLPRRPKDEVHAGSILQTSISVAFLLATLFVGFSPKMFSGEFGSLISSLLTPQPQGYAAVPTTQMQVRIGIVSGHWGHDAGAVCPNGVTEQEVNLTIATLVQQKLSARGFQVDLLQEFDPRLSGYKAAALVSIHNDTCDYVSEEATGFKVAGAVSSRDPNSTSRLTSCLRDRYGTISGLAYLPGNITEDMTDYHAFQEIDSATTAAIIEAGFLNKDYDFLTGRPDVASDGIVAGILCFVNNESVSPTPPNNP
jgi:N-acetylmuramoyl-L-alanine amidase